MSYSSDNESGKNPDPVFREFVYQVGLAYELGCSNDKPMPLRFLRVLRLI